MLSLGVTKSDSLAPHGSKHFFYFVTFCRLEQLVIAVTRINRLVSSDEATQH